MLPVAPTSPLWWVARWSSRLLTGLALAVALSLGGSAGSDAAAPRPANAPALADLAVPDVAAVRAAAGPAGTVGTGSVVTLGVGDAQGAGHAILAPPADPIDPAVGPTPAHPVTVPAAALTGLAVAATGPRAPPLG